MLILLLQFGVNVLRRYVHVQAFETLFSTIQPDSPLGAWTHDGHVIESFELTTVPRHRPCLHGPPLLKQFKQHNLKCVKNLAVEILNFDDGN